MSTGSFETSQQTWNSNPFTGNPWTWGEIDGMRVGIRMWGFGLFYWGQCSQLYVHVAHTGGTLVLRPNGDYITTTPGGKVGTCEGCTFWYQYVNNEAVNDDKYLSGYPDWLNVFDLPDHTSESGSISSITLYARVHDEFYGVYGPGPYTQYVVARGVLWTTIFTPTPTATPTITPTPTRTPTPTVTPTPTITPTGTPVPFCSTGSNFSHVSGTPIPDQGCPTPTADTITVSALTGLISKVTVRVNITHTWMEDLKVYLRHPGGTLVTLAELRGGDGDGYVNTIFDDAAATAIAAGTAPFTGAYRPESPMSGLNGLAPNGAWQLEACDNAQQDEGTIDGWDLCIETTP